MVIISVGIILVLVCTPLYNRYVPVYHIHESSPHDVKREIAIIDVRDYNDSYKTMIPNALNLPIAYLVRHMHEIPKQPIHIVAASKLELNMSVRILRRAGYSIESYSLIEEKIYRELYNANMHVLKK